MTIFLAITLEDGLYVASDTLAMQIDKDTRQIRSEGYMKKIEYLADKDLLIGFTGQAEYKSDDQTTRWSAKEEVISFLKVNQLILNGDFDSQVVELLRKSLKTSVEKLSKDTAKVVQPLFVACLWLRSNSQFFQLIIQRKSQQKFEVTKSRMQVERWIFGNQRGVDLLSKYEQVNGGTTCPRRRNRIFKNIELGIFHQTVMR